MLRVGSASRSITPSIPLELEGYLMEVRNFPYTSINEDIYTTALWIEQDNRHLLFISLELIGLSDAFLDKMRTILNEQYPQLPAEHILLNATHTHCAPRSSIISLKDEAIDESYEQYVVNQIIEAVKEAYEHLEEAEPFYRSGKIKGLYGSRLDKEDEGDKMVYWVEFINDDFEVIGSMINISCHSTILSPDHVVISGDLLGKVAKKLNPNKLPVITMGAAADMSTRYYRQGTDEKELERVSDELVLQMREFLPRMKLRLEPFQLIHVQKDFSYQMQNQKEDIQKTISMMKQRHHKETDALLKKQYESIFKMREFKILKDHVDLKIDVQILYFGDLQMVFIPGELGYQLGMKLKESMHALCPMIITCANTYLGYMLEHQENDERYEVLTGWMLKGQVEELISSVKFKIDELN